MIDFTQAFQNDHNNISDAVNEIGRWLVKFFHLIAQSHMTFLMRLEEFIRKLHFPSPVIRINPFSKTTSSERKNFFAHLGIFIRNVAFPSLVSHAILKNAH